MKRIFLSSVLAVSITGAMPGVAQEQADEPGQVQLQGNKRISLLLNRNVVDQQGTLIGEIEDVLINQKGEIQHLVVGAGGFWGLGGTIFQLPWNSLSQHRTDTGYEAALSASEFTPEAERSDSEPADAMLWKLSSLIGMTADINGMPSYGEVEELLFDPESGRVTYLILERSGWAADRYAVPWVDESILGAVNNGALLLPFSETDIQLPGTLSLPANDNLQSDYVMNLWL